MAVLSQRAVVRLTLVCGAIGLVGIGSWRMIAGSKYWHEPSGLGWLATNFGATCGAFGTMTLAIGTGVGLCASIGDRSLRVLASTIPAILGIAAIIWFFWLDLNPR